MIIFGYEHEWGMALPQDDDVWRLIITSDFKNNVIVWRGFDKEVVQCTVDNEVIWKIKELISQQDKLFKISKLEEDIPPATDIPCYDFFFNGRDGRHVFLSGYLFGYERGQEYPNTSLVMDLVLQIQKILQDNGLSINIAE